MANKSGELKNSISSIISDYRDGMTVYDIEKKYNVSQSKIYYQLNKNNVELYKRYNLPTNNIHNDYMSGLSIREIEIKYGLHILLFFPKIELEIKNNHFNIEQVLKNIKRLNNNDGIMICSESKIDINNFPIYKIINIYNNIGNTRKLKRELKIKYDCDIITNILNIDDIIWYVKEYYSYIKIENRLSEIYGDNLWLKRFMLNHIIDGKNRENQQVIHIKHNRNFVLRYNMDNSLIRITEKMTATLIYQKQQT